MKTYKYKLKLTKEQSKRVDSWICTSRYIYNLALETKIESYKKGIKLSKFDLINQLPDLKHIEWIKDVPSMSLQNVIERLDHAYQKFFTGGGFPKWAKRDEYKSITFRQDVSVKGSAFKLPKIGIVKVFKDRMPDGKIKLATIIKENNAYYLSVTFESEPKNLYPTHESQVVGLDMGISYFLVDSNGCFVDNPRHTLKYAKKLRVKQRALSRKKKGSNSRLKSKKAVAKLHTKITNVRKDFLHKLSLQYVKENSLIVVEDLKVRNMIKFGHLAKHINDASWSTFFTMLDYKSTMYDKTLVKINPRYTSQKCNCCGHIARENRLSQSKFKCVSCGHKDNADFNASKNILSEGIALIRQREALACA